MSSGNVRPKGNASNYRLLHRKHRGAGLLDKDSIAAANNSVQGNAQGGNQQTPTVTQTQTTPQNTVPPNRPAPLRPGRAPFQSPGSQKICQDKVAELTSMADINVDLVAIYDKFKVPAKEGGVDRGLLDGGMGTFKSVMDALQKLKHTSNAKAKDWQAAISKLEVETQKWLAKDSASNNPDRLTDEVSVRKRQTAQAIAMSLKTQREIDQAKNATDWNSFDAAIANAEINARNTKVAAIVAMNPPNRIGGPPKKAGSNDQGGKSDSYFVKDGNNLTHVFKPQKGEYPSDGFPTGGGAPREVLMSEFNDGMKEFGFDFKIPKTTIAELNSSSFGIGGLNQETNQVGVIIDAIKNASDARDKFKDAEKAGGNAIGDLKASIDTDDIHDIAILDFMTLNLDRNPGNVMIQPDANNPQKMRLIPIDAGNLLPPKDLLDADGGFDTVASIFATPILDPNDPLPEGNMMTLMPQSSQPLSDDRIAKLLNLDPAAVADLLRRNNAKRQGSMAGKIGDDSFELVENSVAFLKCVAALNPKVTLNEIGKMYGMAEGFGAFSTARDKIIAAAKQNGTNPDFSALPPLVDIAAIEARKQTQDEADKKRFDSLGGTKALLAFGWKELDLPTVVDRIDVLVNKRDNPTIVAEIKKILADLNPSANDLGPGFDAKSVGEKVSILRDLATNKRQLDFLATFPDGTVQQVIDQLKAWGCQPAPQLTKDLSVGKQCDLLNRWGEFQEINGMKLIQDYGKKNGGLAVFAKSDWPDSLFVTISTELKKFKRLCDIETKFGGDLTAEYVKFRDAIRGRNLNDKSIKDNFAEVSMDNAIKFFESWTEIKDWNAFRDYNQMMATTGQNPPKSLAQFVSILRGERAKEVESKIGDDSTLEKIYLPIRDALRARKIGEFDTKDSYQDLNASARIFLWENWNKIKDLPAFLNYNALVNSGAINQVAGLIELVEALNSYKG